MKQKLENCPWCGQAGVPHKDAAWDANGHGYRGCYFYYIECSNQDCRARAPHGESDDIYRSEEEAWERVITAWNTRPVPVIERSESTMKATPNFDNEFSFCSNFAACEITYEGRAYKTSEHAFQAAKTLNPNEKEWVASASTPGEAKRRGRQVTLRPDWETVKDQVMLDIVRIKFQDPDMKWRLIKSRDWILCENNYWHDNYWGNCTCERCQNIFGQNKLGKILMQVREEVINQVLEDKNNGNES